MSYAEAVTAVKAALKDEGFGVLCEIDVAKTLKERLGTDVEPQVIFGACNPALAQAIPYSKVSQRMLRRNWIAFWRKSFSKRPHEPRTVGLVLRRCFYS
jgi:hypothetical protein